MAWQPEELTAQIDGVTAEFVTTFSRVLGQLIVFYNGEVIDSDQYEEPDTQKILLDFVPQVGDTLIVNYLSDQTFDGRVRGFIDDPSVLPPADLPLSLQGQLEVIDDRLDALEQRKHPEVPPFTGTDGLVLTETGNPNPVSAWQPAPGGGAESFRRAQFTPTPAQTVFATPSVIGDPDSIRFVVNNLLYELGTDYQVTGTQELTWLDNEFTLDPNDRVEIVYVEV